MSIYDLYESDPVRECEGVWINTISEPEEFLIASAENPKFSSALARMYKPHADSIRRAQQAQDRGQDIPENIKKLIEDLELKAVCRHVLLGWKNVKDREGNAIEYTPENAYKLLSDPSMHKLKAAIWDQAEKQANFIRQDNTEEEKN